VPGYLQSCFTRLADMTSRQRLRSSASHRLAVPPVPLYSQFPAPAHNDLPSHVTSSIVLYHHTRFSDSVSKHSYFPVHTQKYDSDEIISRPWCRNVLDSLGAPNNYPLHQHHSLYSVHYTCTNITESGWNDEIFLASVVTSPGTRKTVLHRYQPSAYFAYIMQLQCSTQF